jgi:hypothetical protein
LAGERGNKKLLSFRFPPPFRLFLPQETILQALKLSRAQQAQSMKQPPPPPYKWTYASAFLYSLTLITTIGEFRVQIRPDDIALPSVKAFNFHPLWEA